MGNTCVPVVDSCWCVAKPIQYCKVKNIYNTNNKLKKEKMLNNAIAFTIVFENSYVSQKYILCVKPKIAETLLCEQRSV